MKFTWLLRLARWYCEFDAVAAERDKYADKFENLQIKHERLYNELTEEWDKFEKQEKRYGVALSVLREVVTIANMPAGPVEKTPDAIKAAYALLGESNGWKCKDDRFYGKEYSEKKKRIAEREAQQWQELRASLWPNDPYVPKP